MARLSGDRAPTRIVRHTISGLRGAPKGAFRVSGAQLPPLPVPAPINRGRSHHGQPGKAHGLAPVVHPAVILAPCGPLGVADQICARDVVVVTNLGPAKA